MQGGTRNEQHLFLHCKVTEQTWALFTTIAGVYWIMSEPVLWKALASSPKARGEARRGWLAILWRGEARRKRRAFGDLWRWNGERKAPPFWLKIFDLIKLVKIRVFFFNFWKFLKSSTSRLSRSIDWLFSSPPSRRCSLSVPRCRVSAPSLLRLVSLADDPRDSHSLFSGFQVMFSHFFFCSYFFCSSSSFFFFNFGKQQSGLRQC